MTSTDDLPRGLRAGLLLGLLRAVWMAVEHLLGFRTTHLEWVEPTTARSCSSAPHSSGLFSGVNDGTSPTFPNFD